MKTVCLVTINPQDVPARAALLSWGKARAVPVPGSGSERLMSSLIYQEGMLCEVDEADLEEARTFGEVTVHANKEVEA